jgi:hypothetical protein
VRRPSVPSVHVAVAGALLALVSLPAPASAADAVTITSPQQGAVVVVSGDPGNPGTAADPVVVTFVASGGEASCSIDSGPLAPCTSPASFPHLTAGAHTVTVSVAAASATATVDFTLDTVVLGPPPQVPAVAGSVHSRWHAIGARTTNRRLVLTHLQRRAHVTLTCRGRGCGTTRLYAGRVTRRVSLSATLRGHALRPGAQVSIRVAKPGFRPKVFVFTTRRGAAPTLTVR